MTRLRFPIAVLTTSLVLVGVLFLAGTFFVPRVFAGGLPWGMGGSPWGAGGGPPWAHGAGMPFAKLDGAPFTVAVTPGTVSAASATSLTVATNDGSSRTFTLDDKTAIHGPAARGADQAKNLASGEKVVVVVLDNAPVATAVLAGVDGMNGAHAGGPPWGRAWGHGGWWH